MKGCELCSGLARMYCESDQASLCFDCDAKVHGANFLVARHSRILLCRSCQSPTPWKAAGARLGPTVSVCDRCVGRSGEKKQEEEVERVSGGGDEVEEDEVEEDEGEEEEEEEEVEEGEEEEEEEGEEQVVPWTMTTTPPPVPSSSSSEESPSRICNGFSKRMRENVDLASQDHLPCSSSRPIHLSTQPTLRIPIRATTEDEATSDSFRPSKDRKKADFRRSDPPQLSVDLVPSSFGRRPI